MAALAVGMRPAPEGEAAEQEHEADRGDRQDVEAGARERLAGRGLRLRRGGRRGLGLRLGRGRLALGLALRGRRLGLAVGCGFGAAGFDGWPASRSPNGSWYCESPAPPPPLWASAAAGVASTRRRATNAAMRGRAGMTRDGDSVAPA